MSEGAARAPGPLARLRLPVERLQAVVDGLVGRRRVRHAVLAVESLDGAVGWSGAAGIAYAAGGAMRPDVPYFIASIDKLYIAVAVLRLHERGELDLDECVAAYLPPELTRGIHVLGGVDRSGEIRVRQLLGHTSGLADYLEDRPRGGRSLVEQVVASGEDRAIGIEEAMRTVRDELKPHFPPQDPRAPRAKLRYSDTNYRLLISVIETLYRRPLHEVFAQVVFAPAGMTHTYLAGASEPREPVPAPAALFSGGEVLDVPLLLESLHSVYSTAADQVASLRALIRGRLFDDPATLELMQRPWRRFGFPRDAAALRAPNWPIEYGLGIMRFSLPRVLTPFRPLPAVIGHSGSTGSWLFYCPRHQLLMAGTVDEVSAGAVPYRIVVPGVLRAVADANRH